MSIKYDYEIIKVDESAKVMEIVYTAEGYQPHHISARIPFSDETLEDVIEMFSPVVHWESDVAPRISVNQGLKGQVDLTAREAQAQADADAYFNSAEGRKERAAARRYDEEIKGITISNMEISTDRTSQALLTGAVTAAQLDPNLTAKWKLKNGHVTLDKTQLDTIAMAVRNHVQACFDREIEIIEAIDAGTFTDAMLDEGWPA